MWLFDLYVTPMDKGGVTKNTTKQEIVDHSTLLGLTNTSRAENFHGQYLLINILL